MTSVPTLRDYPMRYRNIHIREETPKKSGDLHARYNISDKNTKYFFFINSAKDIADFDGFDVTFVYSGTRDALADAETSTRNVFFLENDPTKLIPVLAH